MRLRFFSCKHYLRRTPNNLNIRHTHNCLLRIVSREPRAHAGLFQTLRTENQQRTSAMKGCFRLVVRSGLGIYDWIIIYLHQMLAIIFMSIDLLVNFQLEGDMSQQKLNCLRHDKDTLGCEHSPIPILASRKSPRMATKNLPKQATWLRFICFSCKSPMTPGLKNPPRMAWNNFLGGIWIKCGYNMIQRSSKT